MYIIWLLGMASLSSAVAFPGCKVKIRSQTHIYNGWPITGWYLVCTSLQWLIWATTKKFKGQKFAFWIGLNNEIINIKLDIFWNYKLF